MLIKHNCSNNTCELLNPSLTEQLAYEELRKRITKTDGDVVEIAGRPINVAQLKRIENEWVERGLIC